MRVIPLMFMLSAAGAAACAEPPKATPLLHPFGDDVAYITDVEFVTTNNSIDIKYQNCICDCKD